ncbi:MAG TPA: DUF6526 family protein [Vicinamibacterales bacterium]|jgi:hypothetical protein
MADLEQSYKNHARLFPIYHYIASPIMLINFGISVKSLWSNPGWPTAWGAVFAFGLLALTFAARAMALTVQDRVIRLEMQLRLMRVLPPDLQQRVAALQRQHFVALRFASDAELPELVRDVIDGRLKTTKEIKLRVKDWQGDWLRA